MLENYIRDFKALSAWFKVSWDYDAQQKPDRRSLAWEVRKCNPVPPKRRSSRNLSSPAMSGKSSPSFSGKNSPCPPIAEQEHSTTPKASQERKAIYAGPPVATSMDWNYVQMRNTIFSQDHTRTGGPMTVQRLEEMFRKTALDHLAATNQGGQMTRSASLGELNDTNLDHFTCESTAQGISYLHQYSQTDLHDDHLTLAAYRKKYNLTFTSGIEPVAGEDGPKYVEDVKEVVEKPVVKTKEGLSVADKVIADTKEPVKLKANTVPSTSTQLKRPIATKSSNAANNYSTVLSRGGLPVNPLTTRTVSSTLTAPRKPIHSTVANPRQTTRPCPLKKSSTTVLSKAGPALEVNRGTGSNTSRSRPIGSAVRSKTMIEIPGKTTNQSVSHTSRFSAVTKHKYSQDDINSSTSTLKASCEGINNQRQSKFTSRTTDVTNRRSEPKQLPSSASHEGGGDGNNDGWLTVKSKRRSSWSSRFHQPTAYASLPTLSFQQINEAPGDQDESKEKHVENKIKSGKSVTKPTKPLPKPSTVHARQLVTKSKTVIEMKPTRTSLNGAARPAPTKIGPKAAVLSKPNSQPLTTTKKETLRTNVMKPKDNFPPTSNIMRQKSDLTGLKIKSLHREYMRIEKLNGNRNPLTIANSRLTPNEEDELNSATKVDMKIQTGQNNQNNYVNLSSGDEDLIIEESDDDQRKLLEEQENLERQIRELENTEIDVDTETDETDYEVLVDNDEEILTGDEDNRVGQSDYGMASDGNDENMTLEMKYHLLLREMSMGERMQTLATLEAFVARHPGRAQELHQKLSSESRRRSLHETLKKYQAKQARAAEKRDSLLKEKAHKIQLLLARVEDVKQAKQQLIEEKRLRMEERLERATVNRTQFLRDKVKKAHDEDEKLREIAFIKSLTEQNRRLDLLESSKEHEGRMHDLETERQKRVEEKAAKEAAAERRREELELERRKRLEKISETRREREIRVGKIQEQKEIERLKLATQKAKDREERLQALQAAQLATTEELQRKINQKLQESTRRHEELIEHIRQRAQELGGPNRNNEDNASAHESDLSSIVSDVLEPNKGSKKKLKKLKQKMNEMWV